MDSILKKTAKKAPIPTLAVALLYSVISKIFDKEINSWIISIIIVSTFLLSFLLLYFKFRKENKNEIKIIEQEIEDVSTDGGDVLVGADNTDNESLIIERNKITKVKTGGGKFTIGRGRK